MPIRAVVTGGAGFLGSHLCERLLGSGFDHVLCVDNFLTGTARNLDSLTARDGFRLARYDIAEPLHVPGPVDVVLHLASPASPVDYLRHPLETLRAGSLGTWNALELARRKSARFVLASTSESYGDPQVHPQPETYWGHVNPVGPRSCYDEAKRFSEALTAAYRRTGKVNSGIVRIFNTFGPRMRVRDGRVVPTLIRQALGRVPMTVTGDGKQTRSLCYVDDLVEGIVRMARCSLAGPVNLGNPEERTVLDLAHRIRNLTGSPAEILLVPRPQDDPERRCPDITLARAQLGWRPTTLLDEGLRRTIHWFSTVLEPRVTELVANEEAE
ncbi:SDR family oxidoreductase [Streptomyces antnestii]|uniref:SDR family oxidoreductase n=1 Tax=Streptomyces antnestii TaxID=2494256 RepID=A0A3S2YYH8_9ACTN|nr:UDP-glucuronic acid decarboxylase family protein [Streptomyces sp. San01]RVU22417.1 SDR family oxidoreductase [Streptomyces sp. San01]